MLGWLRKKRRGEEAPLFCSAVVPAAGSSRRMGGENKLFAQIGGLTVLTLTVLALSRSELVSEIVVATREEDLMTAADLCRACGTAKPLKLVVGGKSRTESVAKALADELEYQLKEKGVPAGRVEGYRSNSWILLDYESVIIHIFTPEARAFYDLDRLWQDGIPVDPAEYLTK